jgi:hypothetical protein
MAESVPSGSAEVELALRGQVRLRLCPQGPENGPTPLGSGEAEPDPRRSGEAARTLHLDLILGRQCPFCRRTVRDYASAWLGLAA